MCTSHGTRYIHNRTVYINMFRTSKCTYTICIHTLYTSDVRSICTNSYTCMEQILHKLHTHSMRQTPEELPDENRLIHVAAHHEAQASLPQERLRGLSKELLRVHDGRLPFLFHFPSLPQHFCLYGQRAIIALCARPCWHTMNNTMCEGIEFPARPLPVHHSNVRYHALSLCIISI